MTLNVKMSEDAHDTACCEIRKAIEECHPLCDHYDNEVRTSAVIRLHRLKKTLSQLEIARLPQITRRPIVATA